MSDLWVVNDVASLESPILVGDFDFFIRDVSAHPEAKILQYYSEWEDMAVSPSMLDAFESDVRNLVDEIVVRVEGGRAPDPLALIEPLIATAREHHAYVLIVGD